MNGLAARNHDYEIKGAQAPVQMPTISTAVGSLDSLNDRLLNISRTVDQLSDQIGGPRPVAACTPNVDGQPGGAVQRLHESLQAAHTRASDIEDTLKAISRALG